MNIKGAVTELSKKVIFTFRFGGTQPVRFGAKRLKTRWRRGIAPLSMTA